MASSLQRTRRRMQSEYKHVLARTGCGDGLGKADESKSCSGDDDMREKCVLLLKELAPQADDVTLQRQGFAQQVEGGPLWCRLPFNKVSEALKSCRSSADSALADSKQSITMQYTTYDSHRSTADESDLIQDPSNDCRVKETGASSSVLPMYPSPPDSFAEESTPPPVFQGHKAMTVDPSLPSTPDDSSEDLLLGEAAITPFTTSSTKLPGSPSIAPVTPSSSDTVLGPFSMPLCPKTPCSSSSVEGNGCDLASPLVMAEKKPQHPSTSTALPAPQRFLFQVEPIHQMKLSDGQKLFACDICSGVYQRCFSLKRHYLRSHINHRYLTERDISNCGIIVSERLTKESPSGSSVEKKSVAVGMDLDTVKGSLDNSVVDNDITKTCSGNKCSIGYPIAESYVIFPNLYRCHLCNICFDTKNELRGHLSAHKPSATVNKEKAASKPISGNQQARSKSLPDLKKGSKERNRSLSASSQELSSLRVPTVSGQLICESVAVPLRQIKFNPVLSSVAVPDQFSVSKSQIHSSKLGTSGLPKPQSDHSSKTPVPTHSSKTATSSHSSKPEHSSKSSMSDHSLIPVTSNHSLKRDNSSHLLTGKSSSFVHSSKPFSPGRSTQPFSSSHSLMLKSPELISSSITDLTITDQSLSPLISSQFPASLGQFTKSLTNDKLLKSTSSSERGQHLCLYCDKSFSTPTLHKRHVSRSHPHAQLSLQIKTPHHECAYCTKSSGTFRELPLLVQHLLATHPDLYHVCTTCELRFDSKEALYHHQISVHHRDCQWNATQTAVPFPALSHTMTSSVNDAVKLSQPVSESQDGSKAKTSGTGDVDLLVSGGEFQYTCSVCRQVFNDYVAMCRHHRQVHKGKRTINSAVGGVQSPTSRLESRSQSPFVIPEKGSKEQVEGNKVTENHADEQEMKSDIPRKRPVSSVCRESESEVQTNCITPQSKRYDIETNDTASETVDIHHTAVQNKNLELIKQKDSVDNVVKGRSEEGVVFAAGDEWASPPRSLCIPVQFTLFANSADQVDVTASSENKCALIETLDSLSNIDSISCVGNKNGSHVNSCDFTVQTAECGDDVSAGVNGDFIQTSGSDPQACVNVDVKSTNDSNLSEEKEDRVPKRSLKFLFEDISDHSGDSCDLIVAKTSMSLEPSLKTLVGTSDHVKTVTEAKSVKSAGIGSVRSVAILDSVTDSSEPAIDNTLSPFNACSEPSLAESSASHRTILDISEHLGTKSECLLPEISGSLKVHSDVLQVETTYSVDEESKMWTDLIPDSLKCKSLTKAKNFAKENSEIKSLLADVSESVKECSKSFLTKTSVAIEESCDTLLAGTVDSVGKISESLYAGTLGCVIENSKFLPEEISSDYIESNSKSLSDETSKSFEESCETLLTKEPDSLEDSVKSSLGEMSNYVKPVMGATEDTVESSLNVILNSGEPSLGKSSEILVPETLESLKEAGMFPLPDCSNFTEETSKVLLVDNLDTVKGSSNLSSNNTEEYSKFTSADTLHSVEGISKLSLVDAPDPIDEENSKLSLIETVDVVDGSSNLSLIEISNSMELCCEQMFSETSDAEENSKLSLDVAAGALEGRCTPSLVEASNSIEENANSVDIISNKPVLAAESSEISVTESVEENLTVGLPETSDSVEHNVRSPLIDSLEDISESLFRESSVEQNCCPSLEESLYSLEEDSKSASTEIPENVEENSKLTSAESLDAVEEKPKSTSTESSDSVEENLESLESVVEEESKSISIESFDSVKEIHSPILRGSSYSLEEDSKFIPTSLDAVKDHRLLSTEISDCLEKDYKSGGSESMAENSKSVSAENSELMAENPQLLLPDIAYSMDICKPLPHESSDVVNINSGVVLETSDALKGKSKRASSVTQDGGELTSSRILRSNSSSLTKSVYFTEENETVSLHQRLLRSKTEVAINDQLAGSGRVSRKSFAVSVTKPVESVSDFNDHHKADGNRVLRSSGTLKNDEPSVDQEGAADMDVGHSKCRSKASTASTHARHTRLRKFSRRVRGEQLQEEWQLDPETLFYCRIAGNIQENLLHHLDGKLEHEVTVMSRDWNRAGPSQPHVSATTTNQEEKHYHHHRAPWEKFNFPKNYDGRCGEGAVCLASYIKDMSHLDISTQLTMRQNLKRLTAAPPTSRSLADVSVEVSKDDVIGFSRGLCLSAKVCADRRRSLRSAASRGRDAPAAAPGGAASTFTASASLKRWSSADDVAAAGSVVELSGEWVRPRSYICAACGVMFGDLWDLEDHKYSQHPNVWCTHYEFDQAALEQGAEASKFQGGSMSPKDLCRRFLLVREAMETVSLPLLSSEVKCTKCERGFSTLPELHRHILECGGDTTWMLLPSPNTSGRRARKWRPFGSRRRRQQGSHRRGMKRNIPTTPVKQYFRARHRTVAGDSIQRMLANLPAKRSTRRVIQFSEDEIKTRSQGTMHSVSFASGVLRTSQKTGHKVVQSMQVKVTTADSSDSASKKLTVRTPKKLPAAPFVTPSVTSEQSYVPKQQLTVKKQPRSKSQPVTSVPQSKSTGSDVQKKASRGGRSLSPATSKSEPVPLNGSEDTKQPSVHKCRGRSKKKQNLPSVCGELTEPTKKNDGPDIGMQEFDIDFGTGGSTETSNILAAMRIAMLEGVITETPPSVAASTKKVRKKSAKKHPCTEENETVLPGKRKKLVSGQKTLMKRKTKLSQSELEERFLRNKGYTHPDEITDEPIICKGCGLQFDNGSAELRHRKTCIYVPPEEDVGSNEVERSHPCSHCRAQFPSASTLLKHTQQCKAAVKGNTEVTGEPSTSPKKTAAKAKTRNVDNNQVSTATSGKEEDYLGPKRSLANVGNSSENGSTKVKPGVTESKKQITKRSASNSRIIKRKKFDLANSTDDNLDATKKWLTGAENIRSCTAKRKVKSEKIFRTSPVTAKKKPDIVENTHSNPVEANKRLDNTRNLSNSLIKTKKKQNGTENDRNSTVGKKKKPCSSEDVSNSAVVLNGSVSGTQSANSSPRKTKKKKHNGTEIGSGNPLRTKIKLDASNRPVSKNKKLVELESSSDSPAGIGILEGVNGTCTGAKKQIRNNELGGGPVVSRKKQGNVRRSVSSSPVGSKKKLGSSRNYSLVETNRKFESTSNVSGGVVETGQQRPITQSDSVCPDGKEPLNHSESEIEMKRVECDGIENGAESVINNPAKRKKKLSISGSGGGGPVTTNSRLENGEPANIILTGTKKKSGNIDVLKGAKTKSGRCDSMSDVVSERKDKCSSIGKGTCRPPNGDVDDKMPELQKEEPIENLKTETPSPKVEDLCDIPILSPVGFEPLGVGCEEKKSDADHDEMLRKNTAKKEQSLLVQGKKQPKVTVKKGTGLKQVTKTVEIRKPSPLIEKKDAEFEIPKIPLQIHPSKEEILVAVVEAGGLSSEGEVNCDDKPLAECLGVSVTSDKDEAEKDLWEQDVKKAASLSKQQKRKRAQHKNAILLWEGRYKEEATEASTQPTEEDSSDDLLPISKLKEVIQKKTLPTEEIYSNISGVVDENCLIGQMNSRVIEGSEHAGLVERNPLTVTGSCEVFESENVAQHNIEEPLEIPDHVATFRRSAVKKGKRGRPQSCYLNTRTESGKHQSRAHQKIGLPGGYPEAASVSGVHADIQPEAGNIVIYKGKPRNYSEQVESQDSTRVENSVYLIDHEGDIKKKLKRQFDEMESRDGGSTDSTVMREETRNCLFGGKQETNSSVVNEKIVTPLHLYEETGSTVGRKLMVTKRKKFGPRFESAASPLDPVNNAVTYVGRDKRTDHLVDDEHGIKILDVGERRKEMQRERRSSVVGKKSGVTKTKSKRQLDERSSQCKGNAVQTRCEMQEEETDELIGERVAGSDRANSVVGRKLITAKRKSKHNSENRYDSGEVVDCTVDQGKYLRPISGKEAERNRLGIGEQQDGLAVLCEEEETERHAKEPVVEAVSSCEEVTTLSICEEIKVGRRREVRNLTGKKIKANRLINVAKETLQKDVKIANSLTNKTEETRQKIKIIIGKRRKRCLTIVGDQACRLISEEEDKPATYSVKEDVSLGYVGKGDQVKAVEISAKDELNVSISEEDDTGTSVADTDGTINLNCEAENMNVLTCTAEETTNTLVSVAEKTAKRLNTETGETGTSVCWKEETVNSLDGEEVIEDKFREKELSNLDINTSQPAVENEVGLFMHVKRKDVENMETRNVDDWEEYAERMTDEQQEMNSEILGSDIATGEKGAVPAKNENTDSPIHHENYLNPIIIQQGDMNNQIVQLDLSSSAVDIVSGTKAEESQVNVERPLRQARRTRCNTSYEELYTWSDVTSETEDSSQDLPDASVMTALCQDTDAPTYEQIAAMIVNGEHFFPSSSKKKKKKKLRNNSKQYRNGHLRRKRRKKQKLRTRLMKNKRSAVNDFIVTDIETGQEESQDSCESIELPEICKTAHRPMDTETDIKAIRRKKKKKRMKSLVKLESEGPATGNENARVCNSDRSRQKRKSSVGSIFFCTLCNKHYSTNYNLMKHKLSLMHKRMSERYQPSIPTDVQKTDCEQWHSYALQNTTSKDTSQLVGQIIRTEQPNFATQHVETEQPSSDNQKTETEPCNSDRHSVKNRQNPESVLHSVEMEQAYSSVHNTQFDESCSSLVESVESEHPFSSAVQNLETERSCVVLNENTECEEQCSVVQNVEGEESYTAEPERTYTLMQNMDVEQFSSACMQSTSLQETEADESGASAEKPTSETDNEHILDTENAVQNSALDGAQQGTDPTQISSNAGARNDVAATGLSGIATVWTEHQANVTSEWLKKGRGLQQNMNSANWPASGEGQKQAGWFEGLVDNSEWVYTAGQWSQEMAWNREVNPDMNWNADSSQDDGTFFQSNSASLGSILDSVNQILDNERSADGLETTNRYPPYVDLLQSGTAEVNPNGGLRELQQAMGATDEEMAMLEQLGEGSWPLEDADIMDLDNQKSATATSTVASASTASTPTDAVSSRAAKLVEHMVGEGDRREEDGAAVSSVAVAQAAVTTRAVSGRSGLRTQDMQLARYESKDMVCPVCSRRFLGLTALRDHLAAAHNSSTRHRTQAVIKRPRIVPSSASEESGEPKRHVCLVCKELLPDEQGLADHVGVAHVERQNLAGKLPDQRPDGLGGSNHSAGGSGGGDEGLRSHMTSALGGLLTRALNNFLGKNRSQPSPPATQVPSPSVGSPVESHGRPLLTQPVARLLGRGLKMANRRHSSGSAGEQPFNCVDCDERFTSESNRNRHVARAHRGQQYRRLSTDSPLELARTSSPLTSNESTASEVDTDSLPLSIRISNFCSEQSLVDSEPCKSQTAGFVDSETSGETKDRSVVKCISSWKGEGSGTAAVQEADGTGRTACNSAEEEQLERATAAVARSADVGRRQEQEKSESSRTDWRNGVKVKSSQPRSESLCGVNDEDSIKAKAVAALRALNARDRRIRNGLPGTIGAAMWSGVSRKKSRGLDSDVRFRFPSVRKTPLSTNRFASLEEKKKKTVSNMVKCETMSQPNGGTEENRQQTPPSLPLDVAVSRSYDIYEFHDEAEQVRPPSEFGLAEFRLRAPLGKFVTDTGPSSDVEESKVAEWDSLLKDTQPVLGHEGVSSPAVLEDLENSEQEVFKPLRLSEETPKPKFSHSSRKHHSSKKKRWHRIIVDSEEDTSDTDTVAEPHETRRVALDQRLNNHRERDKCIDLEQRYEEGRGVKRQHVPCLSGVLVEDRQCGKRGKTARKPSKGSSKRATKTDLLMSVFAKSRQRNNCINSVAAGRSVPAKSQLCGTFSGPYRSAGSTGSVAGTVNKSDSGCSATSAPARRFATSSDDERVASGTKSESKKPKRGQEKMTAL